MTHAPTRSAEHGVNVAWVSEALDSSSGLYFVMTICCLINEMPPLDLKRKSAQPTRFEVEWLIQYGRQGKCDTCVNRYVEISAILPRRPRYTKTRCSRRGEARISI